VEHTVAVAVVRMEVLLRVVVVTLIDIVIIVTPSEIRLINSMMYSAMIHSSQMHSDRWMICSIHALMDSSSSVHVVEAL
jgi:hypothetical protein